MTFAAKLYDKDGDVYDSGVFIFTDGNGILRFEDVSDLKAFIGQLISMQPEIQATLDNR